MSRRARPLRIAAAATLLVALAVPANASARNAVDDIVGGVTNALGEPQSAPAPPAVPVLQGPRQTPGQGGYTPPLHGTEPHGQAAIATVNLTPSDTRPYPDNTGDGADEEVVVGAARGSQEGQDYHGHITIVSLFGQEILGVDTDEGETAAGPLDPIQENILDAICSGSSDQICLDVLRADSSTTSSGSTNKFRVASAQLGPAAQGIGVNVAESNGNISQTSSCQTASGDSTVASAEVLGMLTADVISSSSMSRACNDGTHAQSNDSGVINLNGTGIPIPAAGCADGTPDTAFTALSPLLSTACNADDSNGAQAAAPYGVREGLTAFLLEAAGTAFLAATTAPSESLARRPGRGDDRDPNCRTKPRLPHCDPKADGTPNEDDRCPARPGPASNQACPPHDDRDACPDVPGPAWNDGCPPAGDAAGAGAAAGDGSLAFTGVNVLGLLLVGLGSIGLGAGVRSLGKRSG